ncbi:glycosyl transferase family 1 [Bacteroidia bacterium]|nr:glycosyl transferase family 1 [Bacteroidia bacterium]
MNIGFDAKRAFCNARGLGNYSRDVVRILSHLAPANKYYLFTPKSNGVAPFDYSSANCTLVEPQNFWQKKFSSLWRTFGQSSLIDPLHLDIFHGLSNELPVGINKTKARTVLTMHDLIFIKLPHLYSWIDRRLYTKKYLHSCAIADKIIAISRQTKEDLMDMAGIEEQKIEVVYQGCSPLFLRKAGEEEILQIKQKYHLPAQYLLNVGAIETRKNQALIIQSLIVGQLDIPLVLVGQPTEYMQQLKTLISNAGIESKVIFLHQVSNADLPAIYQGASIFVFPSIYEGFGIPIVEALTSGVPVIAAKNSSLIEAGGQAAAYIENNNAEQLANVIDSILTHQDKRNAMIDAGLSHAKNFSDAHICQQLVHIYTSVLQ